MCVVSVHVLQISNDDIKLDMLFLSYRLTHTEKIIMTLKIEVDV